MSENVKRKSMQDEMNDEWFNLAVENIQKFIPDEWMPRINEILPKILEIAKIAIKKNIKSSAETLGDDQMVLMMNFPNILDDKSTIMVPTIFTIHKNQIGPSELDEATGNYEFRLKDGEVPISSFSMLTLANRICSYNKIEDLIKDVKNGNFITLADINYTGSKDKNEQIASGEQKQIGSDQAQSTPQS